MNKTIETVTQLLHSIPNVEQLKADLSCLEADISQASFLCCDINSLHRINLAYGREVGDALLAAVAQWVALLPGGQLYRIEGDQFCLMFRNVEPYHIYHYASCMEQRFGEPWHLETAEGPLDVFTPVAIAILSGFDYDYDTRLEDLLKQALDASQKERQIIIYDSGYDKLTREHVRLQIELKACVLGGMRGFDVFYQPLVDPSMGVWRGLEALCRWTSPSFGPIPPDIFILEAEEMGLIHIIGNWVLETALTVCRQLGLDEIDHFFVSVNVSALQLAKRNYVESVFEITDRHHYPYSKLLLEITESTQLVFNEATYAAIEMLRAKGISLALDDFGAGFSGFSGLKNLPADMLKTDRAFIKDIENDRYLQYFYYIMSETAHGNGMKLIAEGVETKKQLRSVVKNGADLIQGYLFGQPMDWQNIARQRENFTVVLPVFAGWMGGLDDFIQWIHGQDAYKITPALFRLQSKCLSLMLDEANLSRATGKILQTVGSHFNVKRVFVFLRDEGTTFSNQYEWCAENVVSQKHLFQHMDGSGDGFYDVLRENEIIMITGAEQLPQTLRERLVQGGQEDSIQAIVAMPMKQHGEILGFVGFSDISRRKWAPEELIILHNLCLLCLLILGSNNDA